MKSWRPLAWSLAAVTVVTGCGDDGPAGPDQSSPNPPEVAITSVPSSSFVGETVEVSYSVTDDAGLESVSVAWGTFDAPVNLILVSGRHAEGSVSYEYIEAGTFLITVSATDTDGRTASSSVEIVVELT